MQCINLNGHKIYNVTAGKSVPEWLTDSKKRKLQKEDADIRKRIELIQDFEMPILSTGIRISKNQQYILATGVYKPRVRCFDLNQKSMKFDRCMDAEVVKFHVLSDDYSKMVFLQNDRFFEFHSQAGCLYRMRIPMYGRDFDVLPSKAELFFVGRSNEIVRMNMQIGRFMNPMPTESSEMLCCQLSEHHELLACGTVEGRLEMYDPRTRKCVKTQDCIPSLLSNNIQVKSGLGVTTVKYSGPYMMAAGTSSGQVLLFDIRSSKPITVKDHLYDLPIKNIEFSRTETNHNVILSNDSRVVKIWERDTGKPYTSFEPGVKLNDVCLMKDSGMIFIANESNKMFTYFIPDIGPAPYFCSSLTGITEELEENPDSQVYDDLTFLTRAEVENLGLSKFIGTQMIRAEMHGYFIHSGLVKKAQALTQPFNYEEYKKQEMAKKNKPESRIKIPQENLPKVNRKLAEKLMAEDATEGEKRLLKDSRFGEVFNDPDFQVDEQSEGYLRQKPVQSKLERKKQKKAEQKLQEEQEGVSYSDVDDEDDEDDDEYRKQLKLLYRQSTKQIKENKWKQEQQEEYEKKQKQEKVETNGKKQQLERLESNKKSSTTPSKTLAEKLQEQEDDVKKRERNYKRSNRMMSKRRR